VRVVTTLTWGQAAPDFDVDRNVAYRSTFVIDRNGVLRWASGE
jgi:alkyl hydroperoxide reductase subunit AhpC